MKDGSIQVGAGGSPMNRRTLLRRAGLAAGTLAVGGLAIAPTIRGFCSSVRDLPMNPGRTGSGTVV